MKKWLNNLEKYSIHNLMSVVTVISAVVFVVANFINNSIYNLLVLNPTKVMDGEIWRLVTFIFVTPTSIIFAIFVFYFYYMAGTSLEYEWGSLKFNIYYLIGMLVTIIVSFITDSTATGIYLNLSIFLAYAKVYAETEILIYGLIPIKVKYLGYLNWFFIILNFAQYVIVSNIGEAIITIVPIVNYLVFFLRENYREAKLRSSSVIRMKDYKKKMASVKKAYTHKCEICGITDLDDPDMDFRYCSKCTGKKCYCEKHIRNHEHK